MEITKNTVYSSARSLDGNETHNICMCMTSLSSEIHVFAVYGETVFKDLHF